MVRTEQGAMIMPCVMDDGGKPMDIGEFEFGLMGQSDLGRPAHHQMAFHTQIP
jgi:hypothetical protein